ncbi:MULTISPECIES: hypothetical protein [Lactococcus]|uniref:Uncharacterized protein n=1 Tax=Lactococcus lactis subsp. cremoris TaxID=1359 RepID=A0A161W0A9_LACLC|nr:hypothetical protein [Lactococcus cremoris]KZK05409.1 hypothetical protein AB996_1932 [Lactococcus cremoris]
MNKFIWSIFIPILIFAGLLTLLGFLLETQHFYWLQTIELIYLFGSLLIAFTSFRIWRLGIKIRRMKTLKVLWLFLSFGFLLDLINTGVYIAQGRGLLWGMSNYNSALPAFLASLLLLVLCFNGLRNQMKTVK